MNYINGTAPTVEDGGYPMLSMLHIALHPTHPKSSNWGPTINRKVPRSNMARAPAHVTMTWGHDQKTTCADRLITSCLSLQTADSEYHSSVTTATGSVFKLSLPHTATRLSASFSVLSTGSGRGQAIGLFNPVTILTSAGEIYRCEPLYCQGHDLLTHPNVRCIKHP
jgi:hypothetical protein